MADTGPPLPRPSVRRPELLFLSISHVSNTVLDSTLRHFLFTTTSNVVVLNGELAEYGQLVHLIKLEFPSLKVLRYANAQRIPASSRVASTMYCHFLDHHAHAQVLQLTSGVPRIDGDGTIWTDITNPDTRNFIVAHLVAQVAAHGVDGVLIDSCHTDLKDPDTCVDGALKSRQWPGACRQLLQALSAALPGKLIWFNGLWPFTASLLEAQSALLPFADGATVEFFGYDGRPNPDQTIDNSFETFVERINAVLACHPDKPILVRGTPKGDDYYPYKISLRQARYCYGCYLLGSTPRSAFSYGQSFQLTRLPQHRTGGAAMFSYFEFSLGNPAGPAVHNDTGGWTRPYDGGAVFVAPAEGGTQTWPLTSDWWTTLGNKMPEGTSVVLKPETDAEIEKDKGDAAILLRSRPQPPPAELTVDLTGSNTEWWVQGVTGEYHYLQMILTVRSADRHSAVLVRFETDDPDFLRRPFGILTILPDVPQGEAFNPGNRDYPYGQNSSLGAVQVTSTRKYRFDGTSVVISLDLTTECDPFQCFRVLSVRAIGLVTVESIRLRGLSPIPNL